MFTFYTPVKERRCVMNSSKLKSVMLTARAYNSSLAKAYALSYKKLIPQEDLYRIALAYRIGSIIHHGKTRCDGETPFFDHPVAVADMRADLLGLRWTEKNKRADLIIAALLHDVVEENPELMTYKFLTQLFGEDVSRRIYWVSKRKDDYYARLMTCNDCESIILKLLDNLHNSLTLGQCSEDFQIRQAFETDRYYLPLACRLIDLLPEKKKLYGHLLYDLLQVVCKNYKKEYEDVFPAME